MRFRLPFSGRVLRLLRIGPSRVAQMQAGVRRLQADQQKLRRSMNGYNFTERVRKSLALAREASCELRHPYVGTEHILLGLVYEGQGVATTVLENMHVDLAELREDVMRSAKPGSPNEPVGPDLPYTSRAKKVLEMAMSEAREFNHAYVGTEHLLLGVLREERGLGAEVLKRAGVTLEGAREETLRVLGVGRRRSPVHTSPVVGSARSWQTMEPWRVLAEPTDGIVAAAYGRARAAGREVPNAADLFEAIVMASPEIAAAMTSREIEIDALVADVRRRIEGGSTNGR